MTVAVAATLQESNAFLPIKPRHEGFCPIFGLTARARHRGKHRHAVSRPDTHVRICAAWAVTAGRVRLTDTRVHGRLGADQAPRGLTAGHAGRKWLKALMMPRARFLLAGATDQTEFRFLRRGVTR